MQEEQKNADNKLECECDYMYNKIQWKDFPSEETPITAENLNKMDNEIWNITNSEVISKKIIENAGLYTEATISYDDGNGKRQSFFLAPYIDGNQAQYCGVEYRFQVNTGIGILNNHKTIFYICDVFDQANIDQPDGVGIGYGNHGRIMGHYAPGANPVNRVMQKEVSNSYVDIITNEQGTVELYYKDGYEYRNQWRSLIFKAELWQCMP